MTTVANPDEPVKRRKDRPPIPCCPRCAESSQPEQRPGNVVRHKFCQRVLRVFREDSNATVREIVTVSSYRCKACKHVFREAIPDELRGRWYASSTIARVISACAQGLPAWQIRARFGFHAPRHVCTLAWEALPRWLHAAAHGELWPQQKNDCFDAQADAAPPKAANGSRGIARRALDFLVGFAGACASVEPDIGACGTRAACVPTR
jgi:hypothetical protein